MVAVSRSFSIPAGSRPRTEAPRRGRSRARAGPHVHSGDRSSLGRCQRPVSWRRVPPAVSRRSPDQTSPSPCDWTIRAPGAGTRDQLEIRFPESLDSALARRLIIVEDSQGLIVKGEVSLASAELRGSAGAGRSLEGGRISPRDRHRTGRPGGQCHQPTIRGRSGRTDLAADRVAESHAKGSGQAAAGVSRRGWRSAPGPPIPWSRFAERSSRRQGAGWSRSSCHRVVGGRSESPGRD